MILGHRAENREKNRNPSIVPPDERRPYLTSFQSGYNSTTNNDAGRIFANPMLMLNSFCGKILFIQILQWYHCNILLGDYINAVFVDGFTGPQENIVTEWPMSHTVANFWAMVYDFDITAVVVLHPTSNPKSSLNKRNYGMRIKRKISRKLNEIEHR